MKKYYSVDEAAAEAKVPKLWIRCLSRTDRDIIMAPAIKGGMGRGDKCFYHAKQVAIMRTLYEIQKDGTRKELKKTADRLMKSCPERE